MAKNLRKCFIITPIGNHHSHSMRRFLSLLLLLSLVSVSLVPRATSESYVTSTYTSVNEFTYTNTIFLADASATSTVSGIQTIVYTSFTISGAAINRCEIYSLNFDAQQGTPVSGVVTANLSSSIMVYILSESDYSYWSSDSMRHCDPADSGVSAEWESPGIYATSATVKWTPNASGKYWLTVESLVGGDNAVVITLGSPYVQTVTSIQYSSEMVASVFATTQIFTSVQTQQPNETQSAGNNMILPTLTMAIVLGVVILTVIMLRRRKRA